MRTATWLATHPRDLRVVPAWYRSLRGGLGPLESGCPWLTFSALGWLGAKVESGWRVFEWGSGGSTLYLARRVAELVSVEHDPKWFSQVQRALSVEQNLTQPPELHLIAAEAPADGGGPPRVPGPAANGGFGAPVMSYVSERSPGETFRRYASFIDRFAEGFFDLVLVDGRARNACIAHALSRVRHGGWLMLDNAERDHYGAGRDLLAGYERIELRGLGPWAPTPWLTTAWRIT